MPSWTNGIQQWPPQSSCEPGTTTNRNGSTNSAAATLTNSPNPPLADALAHLRDLAENGPLTLLTATKAADISEAAVLAALLTTSPTGPDS